MPMLTELSGTFEAERVRFDEDNAVGTLSDGSVIIGRWQPGQLVPQIPYRFMGKWTKHKVYGPQFRVEAFVQREPNTRTGVIEYLRRYCTGIGLGIGNALVDHYGPDQAIAMLRRKPEQCAREIPFLSLAKAQEAAKALKEQDAFCETKVRLLDLFAGRGFPHDLVEACIRKFGLHGPDRIRRDPFCLLVNRMPGCGFLRVDRLYLDLGHPPDRLKRQIVAAWHLVNSDSSGSTWHPWEACLQRIGQVITGTVRAERALKVAVRAKWLAVRKEGGKLWVADWKRAEWEGYVAKRLEVLCEQG